MKMIIGGKKVDSKDGKVMNITNPANGKVIDTVPCATKDDIDLAVKCGKEAQKTWGKLPVYARGNIINKFVAMTQEPKQKEMLASLLSQETGKPITEAFNEIGNIPTLFTGFVEKAKHLYGEVFPTGIEPGTEANISFTVREPLGVVGCIIPFNFPVDLFGQKIAPALVAGNSALLLPSPHNPLTLMTLCGMLMEAGVPEGVIQVVTGEGPVVGPMITSHPNIDLISLTGSTRVGIETMTAASKNLTHVALELGGNDAFIMLEDSDVDLAVEETIFGRTYNTGQVCCASKRFIVHNSIKDEFVDKLTARFKKLIVGDPSDPKTTVGCLISENAAINIEKQVNLTVEQGAKIVYGGKRNGSFYDPTILVNVTKDMDVAKDMEIFGPVVPVIGFDTPEEAIEIANQSVFGLSGNVFSKNINSAVKVASALECGGVVINGCSFFRSCEMPFGGHKMSGIGNEGISTTLDEMTKLITITLKNVLL
jgi:acyl-CoA reductase-like NAD-dependent aldehyde dehydrogenase